MNVLLLFFWFNLSAPLTSTPVWTREFASSEELIAEFCRECRIVRKGTFCFCFFFHFVFVDCYIITNGFVVVCLGLAGDLKKAMKDGKPIIIEVLVLYPL